MLTKSLQKKRRYNEPDKPAPDPEDTLKDATTLYVGNLYVKLAGLCVIVKVRMLT